VWRTVRAIARLRLPAHVRADIRDHELVLAELARVLSDDSDCLDVGAHEGSVLGEIVRLAPRGRHVAWEPLPAFARRLAERFPSVEVRAAALGDRAGTRDFAHVVGDPGWSGFVARPTPRPGPVEWLEVPAERLDDALPPEVRPVLVKLDVEGAEAEVLRGGMETLRRHRPVLVFEHGLGSADFYGTRPETVHDLLAGELGYEVRGLAGDGPYERAEFARIFARGDQVNFIARPPAP
jgi:FkbM family methyltransferase